MAWEIDSVMIKDGFTINECAKCVYTKTVENICIIVCLYVYDMMILGTNITVIKSTKRMLSNNFDMKDMGVTDVILEIKSQEHQMESAYLNLTRE